MVHFSFGYCWLCGEFSHPCQMFLGVCIGGKETLCLILMFDLLGRARHCSEIKSHYLATGKKECTGQAYILQLNDGERCLDL